MNPCIETPFDTWSAWRSQVLEVIRLARHRLWVFEHQLSVSGLESPAGLEALGALLRRIPVGQLRIVVGSDDAPGQRCPQLLELLERHGQGAALHVLDENVSAPVQCFVLADDTMRATRFHHDAPRGKLCAGYSPETGRCAAGFESMWLNSSPAPGRTPTGL